LDIEQLRLDAAQAKRPGAPSKAEQNLPRRHREVHTVISRAARDRVEVQIEGVSHGGTEITEKLLRHPELVEGSVRLFDPNRVR
jgi:hypothetical protein